MDENPYMPYRPRGCQAEMFSDIRRTLDEGRHIVMESGTGTGKTVVSLCAALAHAKPRGKKVVYLTRTISQSDQVMKELRAISSKREVSGIAVTGRGKSCPVFRDIEDIESIPSHVQYAMCQDRKRRRSDGQDDGCGYDGSVEMHESELMRLCSQEFPTSDRFDLFCERLGICPYEARRLMIGFVDVVCVPYTYILTPDIRSYLLSSMVREGDPALIVPIIDEAHNFIDHARDTESFTITKSLLESAEAESIAQELLPGVLMKEFISFFKRSVKALATERIGLGQSEHMIRDNCLESKLMARFNLDERGLALAIDSMTAIGTRLTEEMVSKGKNGASSVELLGIKMGLWCTAPPGRFVRTVKTGKDGEYLRAACIGVEDISGFLRTVPGAVHMSGTLKPLDQYARVLGLPGNARFRTYPSPFPPENRRVIYSTNLTTRFSDLRKDPAMKERLEQAVIDLCGTTSLNTIVLFTSYAAMDSMRSGIENRMKRRCHWEGGTPKETAETVRRFRSEKGGVLFSVMGGSIAEGIDFPGDELCFAIIVGIPYPPPSSELSEISRMLDRQYGPGRGWRYASEVPAIRKVNQAIGRLIRTETDRGLAVILDSRASRYERQFDATPSDDVVSQAERFFKRIDRLG
ncbi:MAG: ATP-dependent DNA helicase [Candidatus Methanomethylophilaceae archaeon]|nr:ATP-dependent DNA helicase [Candidatus Methanomethylophilaceae archaeon]